MVAGIAGRVAVYASEIASFEQMDVVELPIASLKPVVNLMFCFDYNVISNTAMPFSSNLAAKSEH